MSLEGRDPFAELTGSTARGRDRAGIQAQPRNTVKSAEIQVQERVGRRWRPTMQADFAVKRGLNGRVRRLRNYPGDGSL